MKTIKRMHLVIAGLLVMLMTSCGPAYVNTGVGYGPRPYGYNYGYRPYGYARPYGYYRPAPPVVVRPRYYAPAPRYRYYNNPGARSGYGSNRSRGRGPR
ncbi:hypothetical protein IC229_18630 [Spirosoma sp. BT702]|uniref:Lipoprotein n=1 Tax=Spirosoma profusum TaxID=2771354 RepID=A0A926XXR3_9BACT|nr:hypothetical protein [Spirosoma profusum]MBD2702669.1 hypothetical protein [Spirosoma profusum]